MAQELHRLREGDMVRFEYTLYVEGDKKPFDTSREDVAKEHDIHRNKHYRPVTVTLGRRQIIPGLEEHILEHGAVGEEQTAEIGPEEAYGPRDPQKLKDIPMAEFKRQKVKPEVGMQVNLQEGSGIVVRVAGGRVRVDLNHDLAGKSLRYVYTVKAVITDETEKLEAALDNIFPMGGHKLHVTDDTITLELPDQAKFDQNWMQHKFRLLTELRTIDDAKRDIRLVESYPKDLGQETTGEEE